MIKSFASLIPALALAASPALAQGGFLGVSLEPAPEGAQGARIAAVQDRSAASVMGLRAGDVVHAVDGVAVADAETLSALIRSRLPGDIVELELTRDGLSQKLLGVLARRPGERTRFEGRMPGAMTLPPMPQLPDLSDMTEWPEFKLWKEFGVPGNADPFTELQPLLNDIELRLQGMDLSQLPGGEGFGFRFDGEPFKAGGGTTVQLRYPADTPLAEQERLRAEAVAKYGDEVIVEFAGKGTSVTIQRHSSNAPAPAPVPPVPPTPPVSEKQREF
jgi:membrane-associated protease RseP (regulator of RpoE activity)